MNYIKQHTLIILSGIFCMHQTATCNQYRQQALQLIQGLSQTDNAYKIYLDYAKQRINNAQKAEHDKSLFELEMRNLTCFSEQTPDSLSYPEKSPARIMYRFTKQIQVNALIEACRMLIKEFEQTKFKGALPDLMQDLEYDKNSVSPLKTVLKVLTHVITDKKLTELSHKQSNPTKEDTQIFQLIQKNAKKIRLQESSKLATSLLEVLKEKQKI